MLNLSVQYDIRLHGLLFRLVAMYRLVAMFHLFVNVTHGGDVSFVYKCYTWWRCYICLVAITLCGLLATVIRVHWDYYPTLQ